MIPTTSMRSKATGRAWQTDRVEARPLNPWVNQVYYHHRKECEVEPGETETVEFDFLIPPGTQCVRVYAHFQNPQKWGGGIGWRAAIFHDFPETSERALIGSNGSKSPNLQGPGYLYPL